MKKFLLIITLSLVSFANLFAEGAPGTVEGVIIDNETKEPLDYVSVAIFKSDDNVLVTGTITETNGVFAIKNLKPGTYYLEVTFIGYEKETLDEIKIGGNNASVNLGKVILKRSMEQLDEVEIIGEEMSVEYKIDRKVINVGEQLTSASGSASDILQNLPSITVDVEGNVALRGSTGFMVLIDGRPTVMESSEALQQIPANTIENIEIITNPSAKYNPDGTTGIINIITKKNKLKGFSGTANLNYGTFNRRGGGFLVNYTKKKFSVFLGGDINKSEYPGFEMDDRITYKDDTSRTYSSGDETHKRNFWVMRGGLGYNFTDNDIFNLEINYGYSQSERVSDQDYENGPLFSEDLEQYSSYQYGTRGGNFYSINGSYQHDFGSKEHNLLAQAQYRSRYSDEYSVNQLVDIYDVVTSGQKSTEVGPGAELQLSLDYTRPIGEFNKFEAGWQSRISTSGDETELYWYDPNSGEMVLQPEYSNNTDYDRDIHALYGIYAGENGKFGYQAGLRGEYTYRVISTESINEDYIIDRVDLFPTFHTSYKLPAEQQVMASYSRRIERPRGYYLEPFITWTDAFNVRQGDPDLKPEYVDAMEVAYLKGFGEHSLSLEGYYRISNNKVERIRSVYTDNVMMSKPANVGKDYSLGIEAALSLNITNWWKMDLAGNLFNYELVGSLGDQVFDRQSFNWNSRLSNTFRPFTGNRVQLNGRYNSASVTAQGKRSDYWTADIAMSQEFWKKRMTGILQVRDMFGKVIRTSVSSGDDFYAYGEDYNNAPQITLTLNYRFNNFQSKKDKGGDGDGGGGVGEEF